jgi:hypothetical protein
MRCMASPRAFAAFCSAVIAVFALGAVLAVGLLTRPAAQDQPPALPKGPFKVGQDVPTSFGVAAVETTKRLNGLTSKKLSGATHGIGNFVPADRVQVQASIAMTNLGEEPLDYDPSMFAVVSARKGRPAREARPLRRLTTSMRPGTLQPKASLDVRLSFVAPRDGSKLWVAMRDPGRKRPVLVDLGRTGKTPPSVLDAIRRARHTH